MTSNTPLTSKSKTSAITQPDMPTPLWQRFGKHHWQPSPLTDGMYQTFITVATANKLKPSHKQTQDTNTQDITLCVEAGGNPQHPIIIMVMGLGSQMMFWPDSFLQQLISAGYFVIRFDNRDIGLSSKIASATKPKINQLKMMARQQIGFSNATQPTLYTLHDMAQDTIDLIEALNIHQLDNTKQPCHLMGASMGGMIAQLVTAKRPDLISKLVLLFTSTNSSFSAPPKPRQLSTLIKRPVSKNELDVIDHAIWFVSTIGSPGFNHPDIIRNKAIRHFQRSYYPKGSVQQLNAILATGSIRQYSKKITAPTLVLHGSEDGLIPKAHSKDVARSIANATFEVIDGMGHDINEYYQPYLIKRITQHLA